MSEKAPPLAGLRIVAVEQYGAGPWGSLQLADLGAEVIKIEDPRSGGDVGRYVPPYQDGEDSLFFEALNRNKRSLSLDLSSAEGRAVLHDLVRVSDAVYSNLRGDVPERLGLRFEDLRHVNPRIVCCSLSGFGMSGPRRTDPGYDYTIQALAGWMELTGEPGGPPTKTGLSLVDFTGGIVAALALLAGVHGARRDGVGTDCDVSLYDTAIGLLNYPAAWHLTRGYLPRRTARSAHPSLVPFQAFEASDGWFVVGCAKEKFWQALARSIGREEWLTDPRFADFSARDRNRDALLPLLEEIFRERGVSEWVETLGGDGVPVAPVRDVAAAMTDPHTIARGLVVETEHPTFGTVRMVGSPVRVGDRMVEHRRAPLRGEDQQPILRELLGYDEDTIKSLEAAGAFGATTSQEDPA